MLSVILFNRQTKQQRGHTFMMIILTWINSKLHNQFTPINRGPPYLLIVHYPTNN